MHTCNTHPMSRAAATEGFSILVCGQYDIVRPMHIGGRYCESLLVGSIRALFSSRQSADVRRASKDALKLRTAWMQTNVLFRDGDACYSCGSCPRRQDRLLSVLFGVY